MAVKRLEIYHDESYRKKWFMIGILWVDGAKKAQIVGSLSDVRRRNDYWGNIHFCELTNHSPKAKTAREWFKIAKKSCEAEEIWFYLLAVNRHHEKYERERFSKKFHEYNRFTAITIYSSFRWFFPNIKESRIVMHSDEKSRRPGGERYGDGISIDNFEEYIRFRFSQNIERKHLESKNLINYPATCLPHEIIDVVPLSTAKNRLSSEIKDELELLELCDLLLGAFGQAISGSIVSSKKSIKNELSDNAKRIIRDIEKEPWNQSFNLHRKVSVNAFPDGNGKFYTKNVISSADKNRTLYDFG